MRDPACLARFPESVPSRQVPARPHLPWPALRPRDGWPLPRRALALPALCLLAWPPASLSQSAADRAVNPLTGMPLSLEQMHWSLEQAHLEEQLQASLLNRRKFELERQRLDQAAGTGGIPGGVDSGGAPAFPVAPGVAAPGSTSARSPTDLLLAPATGTSMRNGAAGPSSVGNGGAGKQAGALFPAPRPHHPNAALTASAGWSVVGVRSKGSEWCLLLAESGTLVPVCAGEWRGGHHVEAVSAQGYTVDGRAHVLDIPVARLHAPATATETATAAATTEDEAVTMESPVSVNAAPEAALAALPALQR